MATFGERLRELRQGLNMSQTQIGDLLGVTKVTISDYERGGDQDANTTKRPAEAGRSAVKGGVYGKRKTCGLMP